MEWYGKGLVWCGGCDSFITKETCVKDSMGRLRCQVHGRVVRVKRHFQSCNQQDDKRVRIDL